MLAGQYDCALLGAMHGREKVTASSAAHHKAADPAKGFFRGPMNGDWRIGRVRQGEVVADLAAALLRLAEGRPKHSS